MVHRTLDIPRRHVRSFRFAHRRREPAGVALDPTFQQFSLLGEIERRYDLLGQPGKIKITGFLNRGSAGNFNDAVALAQVDGNAGRHQRGAQLYQPARRQPQHRAAGER